MTSYTPADRIAKQLRSSLTIFAFLGGSASRGIRMLRLTILTLFFPMVAAIGAQLDGTVIMYDGRGHGLLQHAGFLALFASCPVVIFIVFLLFNQCAVVIANPAFTGERRSSGRRNSFQEHLIAVMSFRHPAPVVTLAFTAFIGGAFVLVNAYTTSHPDAVYGRDVWDGASHGYGFYAAKILLAYAWMYLYPLVVTLAFSSIYVTCSIVGRVTKQSASAQLAPYAPDGCGGFRSLGELMLDVVYLDVPFFLVLFALGFTHHAVYWTLKVGAAILIGGVAAELFLPFIQLHKFVADVKKAMLLEIQNTIETLLKQQSGHQEGNGGLALIAANTLYERTSNISTWPYVATDTLRVTLSLVPTIATVARLLLL